jgi:plasmid stabilization system protein ParE
MKISFLFSAEAEFDETCLYYESQQQGLGEQFATEIEKTLDRIQLLPNAWQPLGKRTRRCQTKRFPYAVIYQIKDNEILIVAITHIRRELEHWQNRMTEL